MSVINILSFIGFFIIAIPVGYLLILAASAVPVPQLKIRRRPSHRFLIAIPAHDEASVIAATVTQLQKLNYPSELFEVHVVADHCSDNTAESARRAGAIVHERNEGPRSGKGAALNWLFQRVLPNSQCDAVVIFDADTHVDVDFLRVMDSRLAAGDQVIQGQHVIRNPESGWFPALTSAMFLVDNRFNNLGRSNLGMSAKHMGDSICFRIEVLRLVGWGEGLTEDYQLRLRLLLKGITIAYEPAAIGRGEAVQTWSAARTQRRRWLRGTHDASRRFAFPLLVEGVQRRNPALLDGALQAYFPSYSTLSLIALFALSLHLVVNWLIAPVFMSVTTLAWAALTVVLFIYPLLGLALERAPLRAFLVILSGPLFVVWRTWLAFTARFVDRQVVWVRTSHHMVASDTE